MSEQKKQNKAKANYSPVHCEYIRSIWFILFVTAFKIIALSYANEISVWLLAYCPDIPFFITSS